MTTTINASTSAGLIITPDTSGNIQLQYNGVAAPAFSAYANSTGQTMTSGIRTKIQFNTEEFDTANCFDSTTNYRFTPNLAGYYTFSFSVGINSSATNVGLALYKNGSEARWPHYINASAGNIGGGNSGIIYANGSTDYFEVYAYFATGQGVYASSTATWFNGYMVRSAA